jgi:hypothetical protein
MKENKKTADIRNTPHYFDTCELIKEFVAFGIESGDGIMGISALADMIAEDMEETNRIPQGIGINDYESYIADVADSMLKDGAIVIKQSDYDGADILELNKFNIRRIKNASIQSTSV